MNTKFTSPNYKNPVKPGFLGVLALMLTMNFLLTSCVEEPEAPKIEINEDAQIAQVKSWFEENKTKLRLPERGTNFRSESQELILPFFEKEPDWDKFHHYYFPDGREVFEISLENATKYFPISMLDSFPDRNPSDLVIQNIMFVKHQSLDRFDPLIARYYPANSSSEKSFEDINYQAIDFDWSGTLELFTYDEHHFVGFEIQDGEIVRNYTYTPDDGDKTGNFRIMDVRCSGHLIPVGYRTCAGGYCNTTINYYTYEYSCSGGDLGTSHSYGFPSGGSGSGGNGNTDGNGTCSTCNYNPPSVPIPDTYFEFYLDPDPGIKNYSKMTKTQIFLHLISHLKKAKDLGISLDLKSIFTNLPKYADGNAPIQTARAKLLINGKPYEIYFEYGVKDSWNHIQSFPNLRYRGGNTLWEYRLWNSSSINGALIVIPNEIHDVFLKLYY